MRKQKVLNDGIVIHVIFVLLFAYVLLRAVLVFYVNDEIMTKNGYMIDWNFLPYTGYIDANNHFVLSFLGGLFYRIFNSESIWIIRLPSILAFPLFYYSLVGFKRYLKSNWSILFLIVSVCCTSFFLEFFSIARGYGLSFSFMTFALLQTAFFFEKANSKNVGWATLGWLLAIYTNLSLLPIALFGILFLLLFSLQKKQKKGKVFTVLSLLPIAIAVKYSLDLQKGGKLYLGAESDFYVTTIHSLTELMWNSGNAWLDVLLSIVFLLLSVHLFYSVIRSKNLFEAINIFQIFLFVGIVGILLQNLVFGIFYPENRAATYLVVLFYGSLAFIIDQFSQRWLYVPITVVTLFFFWVNFNFTHTMIYYYEHVDKELFSLIPDEVNGTPPATGARFWQLDDEITKQEGYPIRAFQLARWDSDTLFDYIIQLEELRPNIRELYHEIHVDTISKLILFERNQFLKRKKINEFNTNFDGKVLYYNLIPNQKISPIYIRCSGVYYDTSPIKAFPIIFSVEDSVTHEVYSYGGFGPFTCSKIAADKTIKFDFLYTINETPSSAILKTYIFNPREDMIRGEIKIELYEIVGHTKSNNTIENEL
jgi:hypothetical protein